MLWSTVTLALAICMPAAPPVQTAAPDPVRLAREGHHTEALRLFRERIAQNPGDLEARVWTGRLLLWTGDPEAAAAVFRAVLAEAPANAEAVVGLGSAQLARGDTAAAIETLQRAHRLAPGDADVLAALARAYRRAARITDAVGFARRAASLAREYASLAEDLERVHRHRIEISGFTETLTAGRPGADQASLRADFRARDDMRVGAMLERQHRGGEQDLRAGGTVAWQVQPGTSLALQIVAGPGNVVLPRYDLRVDVAHALGRLEVAGGLRHLRFEGARATVVAPAFAVDVRDDLTIGGRYYLARTAFGGGARATGHSWLARGAWRAHHRAWLSGGYARGVENFETLTSDRLGVFRAHTGFVGLRVELPSLTGVAGAYEHQRRSDGIVMHRLTATLLQRF